MAFWKKNDDNNDPEPQQASIIHQCPNCAGTLQSDGTIRWGCDDVHPELLKQNSGDNDAPKGRPR